MLSRRVPHAAARVAATARAGSHTFQSSKTDKARDTFDKEAQGASIGGKRGVSGAAANAMNQPFVSVCFGLATAIAGYTVFCRVQEPARAYEVSDISELAALSGEAERRERDARNIADDIRKQQERAQHPPEARPVPRQVPLPPGQNTSWVKAEPVGPGPNSGWMQRVGRKFTGGPRDTGLIITEPEPGRPPQTDAIERFNVDPNRCDLGVLGWDGRGPEREVVTPGVAPAGADKRTDGDTLPRVDYYHMMDNYRLEAEKSTQEQCRRRRAETAHQSGLDHPTESTNNWYQQRTMTNFAKRLDEEESRRVKTQPAAEQERRFGRSFLRFFSRGTEGASDALKSDECPNLADTPDERAKYAPRQEAASSKGAGAQAREEIKARARQVAHTGETMT